MISDKCPPCHANCSQGDTCPAKWEPGDGWLAIGLLLAPVIAVLLLGLIVVAFRWYPWW